MEGTSETNRELKDALKESQKVRKTAHSKDSLEIQRKSMLERNTPRRKKETTAMVTTGTNLTNMKPVILLHHISSTLLPSRSQ